MIDMIVALSGFKDSDWQVCAEDWAGDGSAGV